ncbi:hypothetical protein GCK32_010659 [Trichostrongylus colubriformis]|uniref:Uncharacterized protein n=1 Tax=Trichostrongylus colubriformis TaxID=6319 RepID=A0AAN8FR25_TRICO
MNAINRFRPDAYKPMTYNKTLEEEAKEASFKPYTEAYKRFNVTIDMNKRTFKADREQAFMDALFTIQDTVISAFKMSRSHQVGCFINLNSTVCELSLHCQFD